MRGWDDGGGGRQRESNTGRRLGVGVLSGCGTPKVIKGVGCVCVFKE